MKADIAFPQLMVEQEFGEDRANVAMTTVLWKLIHGAGRASWYGVV